MEAAQKPKVYTGRNGVPAGEQSSDPMDMAAV
jgi:hypothetical protein